MLNPADTLQQLRDSFCWNIPEYFNIGVDVCDRWAHSHPNKIAIIHDDDSRVTEVTYQHLKDRSNQLIHYLVARGVCREDRIGILIPQNPWTAIAHISAYKMGAIAIPLFTQFGTDALRFRLTDSGAKVLVTNDQGAQKIATIRSDLPNLETVINIDSDRFDSVYLAQAIEGYDIDYQPVNTLSDDPALIIYTSGTTGNPKGALQAHRTLLGHLPGVEMSHDFFPQPGDKIWTPADWAWIGGLFDVLMPALHHGVPVVSRRFKKFSGETAFDFINKHQIKNAFLPPTALKIMRATDADSSILNSKMRTIASGGETLGAELLHWGKQVFGFYINEFYGQTECNMVVSSCGTLSPPVPGVMGFAAPGHDVQVVNDDGKILAVGELGNIAVKTPDPVLFLGYWNNPEKTSQRFVGPWLIMGDSGILEPNGAIRFVGRDDDVITSSGYRIGPGEIENCLLSHAAVEMAGVIGKPDALRTEIVKAFIVLKQGFQPAQALKDDIQSWVKAHLAAYEYPREITFVESLPLTTTGKIIRRELREL